MQEQNLMLELYDNFENIMAAAAVTSDSMAGYLDIDGAQTDALNDAQNAVHTIERHIACIRDCIKRHA